MQRGIFERSHLKSKLNKPMVSLVAPRKQPFTFRFSPNANEGTSNMGNDMGFYTFYGASHKVAMLNMYIYILK